MKPLRCYPRTLIYIAIVVTATLLLLVGQSAGWLP